MASVGETIGQFTSGFNLGGVTGWITILVLVGVIATLVGVITYWFAVASKFNKKITILENIAGQGYVPTRKDKARLVKIGDGGEEVLELKKHKVYRTAYGKKIGKNTYAFAIGSDGYWYNVTFGDLDKKLKELRMNPIDRDMRYMHVAIRRNIKDRYEKITFLQKYGGLLAYTALIAITGVMMWLLFDKFLDIGNTVQNAVQIAADVNEQTARLLSAMDSIKGGSGITQVS